MSSTPDSVLVAHIFSQTQANITFLASQNYISAADASDIITRLATSQTRIRSNSTEQLTNGVRNLAITPAPLTANSEPVAEPQAPARRAIPPPPPRGQKAKAIWAYNDDGSEPNDLSFSSGEIIEIVEETNADWWTGKCRGRQGLFPSNHVEKISASATSPPLAPISQPQPTAPPSSWVPAVGSPSPPGYQTPPVGGYQPYGQEKPVYRPFGAAYHGVDQPPPAGAGVNSVGLQSEDQSQKQKKSKFGGLGNTMATSAAGGVGFGAGAAIGSGIVNSIF